MPSFCNLFKIRYYRHALSTVIDSISSKNGNYGHFKIFTIFFIFYSPRMPRKRNISRLLSVKIFKTTKSCRFRFAFQCTRPQKPSIQCAFYSVDIKETWKAFCCTVCGRVEQALSRYVGIRRGLRVAMSGPREARLPHDSLGLPLHH